MPRRVRLTFVSLAALVVASGAAALLAGHGRLSDPALRAVFLDLRATRATAAFLVGSALAVAGVVVQGLFRNPLVSPSILGTTAGASFGGQAALLMVAFAVAAWKTAREGRPIPRSGRGSEGVLVGSRSPAPES